MSNETLNLSTNGTSYLNQTESNETFHVADFMENNISGTENYNSSSNSTTFTKQFPTNQPNTALLALMSMIVTAMIVLALQCLKKSKYLGRKVSTKVSLYET